MEFIKRAEDLGLTEMEYKEIIRLFIETSIADLTEFESAKEKNDFQKAFAAMHSIKGAALSLGFDDISEIALKIESHARENNFEYLSSDATILINRIERLAAII